MKNLIDIRHKLHQFPEISGQEKNTSKLIHDLIKSLNPDQLFTFIGSYSLVAVFDSFSDGKTVIFRADLDGLPINESSDLPYSSENPGISHKCGHDGHSSILYGLAEFVAANRPTSGKVILLFQAAEETAEGAKNILTDLKPFKPDFCFGLHNLPGFPLKSIVIKEGVIASASEGMEIKLYGITSHASEPEKGNNPAFAVAQLLTEINSLNVPFNDTNNYSLITPTHINVGEPSFGISPGNARLFFTLRGSSDEKINALKKAVTILTEKVATNSKLTYTINCYEVFPATENNADLVDLVRKTASDEGFELVDLHKPFRWSEDFGYYRSICQTVFFGLGAGINCLPLHNPAYDFPDEIIEAGVNIWKAVYKRLNLI